VRVYGERNRQLAVAENLNRMLGFDHSSLAQNLRRDRRSVQFLTQRNQPLQADDINSLRRCW